jgi:hypothetical protein
MKDKKRLVKVFLGDGFPMVTPKLNRNAKCFCGSGKKQKNCHGMETKYYTTKPKPIVKTDKEISINELNK